MQVIQTELLQGRIHLVCWLPADRRLKPGSVIKLEDEEGSWTVVQQYNRMDHADIKRGWNNNI